MERLAACIDPAHVRRAHQALQHLVASSPWDAGWDSGTVLGVAREHALTLLEWQAPVSAWVVDETSFPKRGRHSVGVARQSFGALGERAKCRLAVSVSLTNTSVSVPAGFRLYLPREWAADAGRRERAGVPVEVGFQTKWRIALSLIETLLEDDVPRAPVVADSAYGDAAAFRDTTTSPSRSSAWPRRCPKTPGRSCVGARG